jgi:hypothetical protein
MNAIIKIVREEIFGTHYGKHVGTAVISLTQGLAGVLGMRWLVALDERMLLMAAVEMVLGYLATRCFADWTEFKGVAPTSIAAALLGMYLGLQIPL